MRLRLLVLVLAVAGATLSQSGGMLPPDAKPGDTVLYDANGKAYLWIHASDSSITTLNGYQPEQVYRLLLNRESTCWKSNQICSVQLYGMTREKLCPSTTAQGR
jgi:hypothetical protein